MTEEYCIEFEDLIEEHGEEKAEMLFEQFKNTPPKTEVDRNFGEQIVKQLPEGMAVLIDAKWGLENPSSDTYLLWCSQYHFYFPTIKSKGMFEIGDYHYYTRVDDCDDGGETFKYQSEAIEYLKQTIENMEIAA